MLIITKVVSSNPVHGKVYSIQLYVIKYVDDLRQVGGFLWFPLPIKLTATIFITEIVLKVALDTITLTPQNVLHTAFLMNNHFIEIVKKG